MTADAPRATCDHCHLPLPRSWWADPSGTDDAGPAYCCFGCRLAAAIGQDAGEEGAARRTMARLGLAVFFSMNVMAFTMALWSVDVYAAEGQSGSKLAASFEGLFRNLVLLFALPVAYLLGWPLLDNAWRGLRRGVFSTDLLLAAGVAAAFAYSIISVVRGDGPIYFEVGCVVLVMVTLGRWLEATGKIRANDALDRLARLMPDRVRRVRDGIEEDVPLAQVGVGDTLRVLAGERIPCDGRVASGRAFVDENLFTGESEPVLRQNGDHALGGTLNLDGDLLIAVTATGSSGALARLIELVQNARLTKGRYERLADRVSSAFVPAVAVIALMTMVGHGLTSGWERGLLQGMAVVLIACPCALGLATPLAVWTAVGRAAGQQVLFRSGDALECLASVRAVRFDKTGTLTTGEPTVASLAVECDSEYEHVVSQSRAIAGASSHLLSRSILRSVPETVGGEPSIVDDVRTFAGRGVVARVTLDDTPVATYLGSRRFLEENGLRIGPDLDASAAESERSGRSLAWIGWDGCARGLFSFDEELRPSAREAIARCAGLGLDLGVLTGDLPARGAALSRELGVPVRAGLLPEDKVAAIREAHDAFGRVAMVGDGVNDAPAMAASDLGVALGCGTDLSRDTAGVCLLGDDLDRLPWAVELARQTLRVIRGNLAWAFGYNAVGVFCAAAGWLSPALASLLMTGSSAFVIVNSLRLREPKTADSRPIALDPGMVPALSEALAS